MSEHEDFHRLMPVVLAILGLLLWVDPTMLNPRSYLGLGVAMGALLCIGSILGSRVSRYSASIVAVLVMVSAGSALASGYFWNAFEYTLVVGCAGVVWLVLRGGEKGTWSRMGLVWVVVIPVGFLLIGRLWNGVEHLWMFGLQGAGVFVPGPLRNPNIAGRMFGLTAFVIWGAKPKKTPTWLQRGLIGLFLAAMVWTGSRGAMLGAAGAGIVSFLRHRKGSRRLVLVAVLFVLIVGVVLVGDLSQATNIQRIQLVPETVRVTAQAPILGVGGWNFGLVYPSVSSDHRWQRHPHNLVLWLMSSFGLLGLLVLTATCVGFSVRPPEASFVPLVVFWGIHEMVDTMVWIPGVLIMTVVAGRLLWPDSARERSRGWGLAIGLIVLGAGLPLLYASHRYRQGMDWARVGEWRKAGRSLPAFGTGFGPAHRALTAWKQDNVKQAIKHIERAQTQNQLDPFYLFVESRLRRELGDTRRARMLWNRARSRDPHDMLDVKRLAGSPGRPAVCKGDGVDLTSPGATGPSWREPRPESYLTIVDRNLRREHWQRALGQLRLLARFPYQTHRFRVRAARRRVFIHRRLGDRRRLRRWERALRTMCETPTPPRSQFHHLFYRRRGIDYAFFR